MANKLGIGLLSGGLIFLATVSLLFFLGVPIIIHDLVEKETSLIEDSETWEKWKDIPLPIYLKFNFQHIKNPNAIAEEVQFELEERGPYVYEQERHKEILNINDDEDSVTFKEVITYRYRQDLSVGPDTDSLNTINVPYVTFATLLRKYLGPSLANFIVSYMTNVLNEPMVLENVQVKDLIFDGVATIPFYDRIISLGEAIGLFPDGPPAEFSNGAFAFYKGKNGTTEDFYKVSRGVKNSETFGNVLQYNGKSELDWYTNSSLPSWEDQYCNRLNGSDGTLFPPFFTKDRKMWIFLIDICRSIYLTYERDINYRGIDAYRFTIPSWVFENPYINEDNLCFCVNPGNMLFNSCNYTGIMRIFPCKSGAPIVISKPHFLDASQFFYDSVKGLNRTREIHDTTVDVEPRTGQLLRAYKRLQISLQMEPLDGIRAFDNIPRPGLLAPLFWAEEYAELDDKLLNDLKSKLIKPLKIITIVQWVAIVAGSCIVIAGVIVTVRRRRKN